MNRIKEYAVFAVWFVGLGYIALWPVCASEPSGRPFGASLFCDGPSFGLLNLLCHSTHPLQMPASLHVLGLLSTLVVVLRLLLRSFKRSRRVVVTPKVDIAVLLARLPATAPPSRARKPRRTIRPIRPRTEFGLRGAAR